MQREIRIKYPLDNLFEFLSNNLKYNSIIILESISSLNMITYEFYRNRYTLASKKLRQTCNYNIFVECFAKLSIFWEILFVNSF